MQRLIDRAGIREAVLRGLSEAPAVALTGAREVGKTTLAAEIAAGWPGPSTIYDLGVPAARDALSATPDRLLRRAEGLVILDEIQRLPRLFEVLRPICDDPARNAVFLLLGSVSWDLVRDVSESLAGRLRFVDMGGLSIAEAGPGNRDRLWMRGGFPRAYMAASSGAWTGWMRAFSRTLLERDIPGLGSRAPPATLERFWRMLAHSHGQTWNASELARSTGLSTTAVNRHRGLLAGSFIIRVLPPWFENLGKRLVRSPKVYLRDSGILHSLLGLEDMAGLAAHPRYWASWEGFALEQTLTAHGDRNAYFYATQRGAELDLMLLRGSRRWGFDFSCSDAPGTGRSMHIALEDLGLEHLWVVYPGDREYPLSERITALPLGTVHGLDLRAPANRAEGPSKREVG